MIKFVSPSDELVFALLIVCLCHSASGILHKHCYYPATPFKLSFLAAGVGNQSGSTSLRAICAARCWHGPKHVDVARVDVGDAAMRRSSVHAPSSLPPSSSHCLGSRRPGQQVARGDASSDSGPTDGRVELNKQHVRIRNKRDREHGGRIISVVYNADVPPENEPLDMECYCNC